MQTQTTRTQVELQKPSCVWGMSMHNLFCWSFFVLAVVNMSPGRSFHPGVAIAEANDSLLLAMAPMAQRLQFRWYWEQTSLILSATAQWRYVVFFQPYISLNLNTCVPPLTIVNNNSYCINVHYILPFLWFIIYMLFVFLNIFISTFRFPLHNGWTWATAQNHSQVRFVPQKRTCAKVFVVGFIL